MSDGTARPSIGAPAAAVDAAQRVAAIVRGEVPPITAHNVLLGLVYRLADERHPAGIPATGFDALGTLRDIARDLDFLPNAVVDHLRPHTALELLLAVRKLIDEHGPASGFRAVLQLRPAEHGGYLTPPSVVALMVQAAGVPTEGAIGDPASRAGELLTAMAEAASASGPDGAQLEFRAGSLTPEHAAITGMNLELHRLGGEVALTDMRDPGPRRAFSRILTNPPFNLQQAFSPHLDWRYGPPPASNANYGWLQYALARLARGGRAAVLMPHAASNSARERRIRAAMVEDGCVEAVVELPGRLFRGTRVGVTLWLLRSPESPARPVLVVDATDVGHRLTQAEWALGDGDVNEIASLVSRARSGAGVTIAGRAAEIDLSQLQASEYDLDPVVYLTPVQSRAAASDEFAFAKVRAEHRRVNTAFEAVEQTAAADRGVAGISAPERNRGELGEICDIAPGAATKDSGDSSGVPIAKPRNVVDGRLVEPADRLDPGQARQRSAYRIEDADILCTRTGTVGRIALATPAQSGWIFGTGLIRLRIRPDIALEVDPEYLALYLTNAESQDWFARNATGSAIQSISAARLRRLPVRLPPLADQRAIARTARCVDDLIRAQAEAQQASREFRAALIARLIPGA